MEARVQSIEEAQEKKPREGGLDHIAGIHE